MSINQTTPSINKADQLWSEYSAALTAAQCSRAPSDIAKARRAWFAFLPEYLPNADERAAISPPAILRAFAGGRA